MKIKPVIKKELKLSRKALFIWIAVVVLTAGFSVAEFPMVADNVEMVTQGIEMMPRIVQVMFGVEDVTLETPRGYFIVMFFWFSLIVYFHAAVTGVTIIARDERDKTSEFLYAKPYQRSSILTAKMAAAMINIAVMSVVTWLCSLGTLLITTGLAPTQAQEGTLIPASALAIVGMLLSQSVFLSLGFLCASFFKTYKTALRAVLIFVLFAYGMAVTIEYLGSIDFLTVLTPFHYFNVSEVIRSGLSLFFVSLAAVIAGVSVYAAQVLYKTRDLMV